MRIIIGFGRCERQIGPRSWSTLTVLLDCGQLNTIAFNGFLEVKYMRFQLLYLVQKIDFICS